MGGFSASSKDSKKKKNYREKKVEPFHDLPGVTVRLVSSVIE
jgi:hypothetical protein